MEKIKSQNPLLVVLLAIIAVPILCFIACFGTTVVGSMLPRSSSSRVSTPVAEKATATLHLQYTDTPEAAPSFTPQPTSTFTQEPVGATYLPLLGRIWSGVKVYYGTLSEKAYGFEIIGGSEDCPSMPSGRGVKVKYPNGKEEWKDRTYLISSGLFFVKSDDPALSKLDWYVYNDCP
ncbi:MAG TPA: hypothetical protein VHM28_02170 [Anaerolineales bacterium]|jgi:hypothetical protein|nr:hypothetical protein [Anaerolineales bacterium]